MNETVLTFLLVALLFLLLYLLYRYFSLKSEIETRVQERYIAWRDKELQGLRHQYEEIARKEAVIQLNQWKQENTEVIRKEAIEKSRVVTLGKVTEHVVPFLPGFQHNPKDARFIGTPVDFIVFDGLDAGEIQQITFIEVKTGSSSLTKRERQIRDAIKQRCVEWEELRIPTAVPEGHLTQAEALPEITTTRTCLHCGNGNREQADFCGYCGRQLL